MGPLEARAKPEVGQGVEDHRGIGLAVQAFQDDLDPSSEILRRATLAEVIRADGKGDHVRAVNQGFGQLMVEDVGRRCHGCAAVDEAGRRILDLKSTEEPCHVGRTRVGRPQAVDRAVAQCHIEKRGPAIGWQCSVDHVSTVPTKTNVR